MEPTPDRIPTGREVLADRSVRFLLTANFLHTSAVIAQFLALGKLVYDITDRELDLGWLGLMEFLPVLLFVTVAGTVADRFERRHIAAIAFGCEALCSIALESELPLIVLRARAASSSSCCEASISGL